MKSPFPGMDPYLESRWRDVHSSLVIYARDAINRQLPSGLLARSEERTIVADEDDDLREIAPDVFVYEPNPTDIPWSSALEGGVAVAEAVKVTIPQAEIHQRYLEIRDARSGGKVVTVIEFVSPTNKRQGEGLSKYLQKQKECRSAGVNLVEIDLTRGGDRSLVMRIYALKPHNRTTYQAWVHRALYLTASWAYRLPLTQRLAAIPIPLRPTDKDVLLELQPLIDQVYENGRYAEDIDYSEELRPPLEASDAEWAANILAAAKKTSAEASPAS